MKADVSARRTAAVGASVFVATAVTTFAAIEVPALVRPAISAPDAISDGRALVRAMHARYDGRWYRNLMLVQDVTHFRDGREDRQERMTEYIALPGRVRAIAGDIADGNAEIYVDGAFHRFESGRLTGRIPAVHGVLVLGFDVYVQDPERTIGQLEELGIDLDHITETEWRGQPVWVVGAEPDHPDTPQFWVEKDRLLCGRVASRRPSGVLHVEMGGFEPLAEGWIATELVFKRNGTLALREDYAEFRALDGIDPALFDVTDLQSTFKRGPAARGSPGSRPESPPPR